MQAAGQLEPEVVVDGGADERRELASRPARPRSGSLRCGTWPAARTESEASAAMSASAPSWSSPRGTSRLRGSPPRSVAAPLRRPAELDPGDLDPVGCAQQLHGRGAPRQPGVPGRPMTPTRKGVAVEQGDRAQPPRRRGRAADPRTRHTRSCGGRGAAAPLRGGGRCPGGRRRRRRRGEANSAGSAGRVGDGIRRRCHGGEATRVATRPRIAVPVTDATHHTEVDLWRTTRRWAASRPRGTPSTAGRPAAASRASSTTRS